jgi:ubiquinone/menaquinone biosynthesis C-methylase UbiE
MCSSPQVNYDEVADSYDRRSEEFDAGPTYSALTKLAQRIKAKHILDLGCGTGRSMSWTGALRPHPVCYGLDFSIGMLEKARDFDSRYRLVRRSAVRLPFAPG